MLEWFGAALGLLGAFLLATNSRYSRFGWIAFLATNMCWLAFALDSHLMALLLMQLGFTATSLLGIWRWFMASGRPSSGRSK